MDIFVGISASKREHSTSGESIIFKRQKMLSGVSCKSQVYPENKLTDSQIQEFLGRVVESTNDWVSQQLESLYDSFAMILENSESDNILDLLNQCLGNYLRIKKTRR